jgi:hypothetical protein
MKIESTILENSTLQPKDFENPNWLNKVMEKLQIPTLQIKHIGIVKQF